MKRLILLLLIITLSSCATYDTKKYEDFKKVLSSSKKITKEVINTNKEFAENAFIHEVYNKEKSIDRLKYAFKQDLEEPPFYYSLNKLDKIIIIHNSLISYSNLLLEIANNDLEGIRASSQELNKSINNLELTEEQYIDIASFAVFKSYSLFTKEKRKKLLKETIEENQKFIEKISEDLLSQIEVLHQSVYFAYDKYYYDLKTYKNKIDVIEQMITLTKKYRQIKKDLSNLKEFYRKIPSLHQNLLEEEEISLKDFGLGIYEDYTAFSE